MEKKIGIWIDKREANIISIKNNKEELTNVKSELEEFNPTGGSGTKMKGGPQDVIQDSKFLEREKQQLKVFFQEVITKVSDADLIVVFGPAETGQKLLDELSKNYKNLRRKIVALEKADSMSDNQLKAWVRDYFDKRQ